MSHAKKPFLTMGNTNAHWGVCGVTSSLYAMWKLEKDNGARARLINAPQPFSVIAEIKTYLRILQAKGDRTRMTAIEAFCQSFGPPFDTFFTIDNYCDHVSAAVGRSEQEIMDDGLFSIGLPPDCVVDYLDRMWGYSAKAIECPPGADPGGDAIIGMTVPAGTIDPGGRVVNTLHNRLVHYMYRRKGLIYSWGMDPFTTIDAAALGGAPWARGWEIGWVIQIGARG